MSLITHEPLIRCDVCGETSPASVHHGWAVFKEGFGESRDYLRTVGVYDLCDSCMRKLKGYIEWCREDAED